MDEDEDDEREIRMRSKENKKKREELRKNNLGLEKWEEEEVVEGWILPQILRTTNTGAKNYYLLLMLILLLLPSQFCLLPHLLANSFLCHLFPLTVTQ